MSVSYEKPGSKIPQHKHMEWIEIVHCQSRIVYTVSLRNLEEEFPLDWKPINSRHCNIQLNRKYLFIQRMQQIYCNYLYTINLFFFQIFVTKKNGVWNMQNKY